MTTNEDKSNDQLEFARREEEQQAIEDQRFRTFRHLLINTSSMAMCLPLDVVERQDTETIKIVLGQLERALDRRGIKPEEPFIQFESTNVQPLTCIHSSRDERS